MILLEYYRTGLDWIDRVERVYINTSNIQYITCEPYSCSRNVVVGINGDQFMLTDDSGNKLLARMDLSKEDLIR